MSSRYARTVGLGPAVPFRRRKPPTSGAPLRKGRKVQTSRKSKYPSATKTKRYKKNRKSGLAADKGVSFFSHNFKSKRLPKEIFKKMVGNQQILNQLGFQVTSTVGRQAVSGGLNTSLCSKADLLSMRDKVIPLVGGVRDPRSHKLFLRSARNVIHMRNQTNSPIKLKLFDIMCKRNSTGSANTTPAEAWRFGLRDDTQSGVLTDHLIVGQMPGQSAEFRYFYKIMAERVIEMQPGAFHEHFFKVNYNKMFDTTGLDNLSGSSDSLAGYTFYTLIVGYGSIGSDSASGTGAVTYLPLQLDVCVNRVYKFGYLEKNTPKYDIESTHNNALTVSQIHAIVSNDFQPLIQVSAP